MRSSGNATLKLSLCLQNGIIHVDNQERIFIFLMQGVVSVMLSDDLTSKPSSADRFVSTVVSAEALSKHSHTLMDHVAKNQ
jgi:hypothetical protein